MVLTWSSRYTYPYSIRGTIERLCVCSTTVNYLFIISVIFKVVQYLHEQAKKNVNFIVTQSERFTWNIRPVILSNCVLVCSLACLVNSSSFIWLTRLSSNSAARGEGGAGLGGDGLGGATGDSGSWSKALVPETNPTPLTRSFHVLWANFTFGPLTFLDPYILLPSLFLEYSCECVLSLRVAPRRRHTLRCTHAQNVKTHKRKFVLPQPSLKIHRSDTLALQSRLDCYFFNRSGTELIEITKPRRL